MECIICYNIITEMLKYNESNNIYNTCIDCVKYQLENNVKNWINTLKNEDCEATIIRMLSSGIPIQFDKDVNKFIFKNKVISGYYFEEEKIPKIININQELNELKDKIKDFSFREKLDLILNKININ